MQCDQAKPKCSRCRKLNLDCEKPSPAQWKIFKSTKTGQPAPIQGGFPGDSPDHDDRETLLRRNSSPGEFGQSLNARLTPRSLVHEDDPPQMQICDTLGDSLASDMCVGIPNNELPPPDDPNFTMQTPDDHSSLVMLHFMDQDFFNWILSPPDCDIPLHLLDNGGQETGTRFGGSEDCDVVTDTVNMTPSAVVDFIGSDNLEPAFRRITASASAYAGTDERPSDVEQLSILWDCWINDIAPDTTPFSSRDENPFFRYLKPRALVNDEVLIAILYLAHVIRSREHQTLQDDQCVLLLERQAEAFIRELSQGNSINGNALATHSGSSRDALHVLTKSMVYSIAFMAGQEPLRLTICLEYAVILCQALFKDFADQDSFLYLVKLLGFMQNSLLFSSIHNRIDAPDYLSVALDMPNSQSPALVNLESHTQLRIQFRGLDVFSGLTSSAANIIYLLGTLICKKAEHNEAHPSHNASWVRTFEANIDELEARLHRHVMPLTKSQPQPRRRSPSIEDALIEYLEYANEAVIWSAWVIFLTDLKGLPSTTNSEIQNAVEKLLDACALIPSNHQMVTKIIFPLAVGGARSVKPVYREFVVNRLTSMRNTGVTDVRKLCNDLELWWEQDECLAAKPFDFTSQFIF